jgi:hypothetical protein
VRCAREDQVGETELLQVAQALELRRVDHVTSKAGQEDVAVYRVVE